MGAPVEVLLQHGWGFDRSFWRPWYGAVPKGFALVAADRGYFGGKPEVQPRGGQIVVAHSFGAHLLRPEVLQRLELLVLIGGFERFGGDKKTEIRRQDRILARMLRRLERQPQAVLADFYSGCFAPFRAPLAVPAGPRVERLLADLTSLRDGRLDLGRLPAGQTLLLHGTGDRIVPLGRSRDMARRLGVGTHIFLGEGHGLPFVRPRCCWQIIQRAWELGQA